MKKFGRKMVQKNKSLSYGQYYDFWLKKLINYRDLEKVEKIDDKDLRLMAYESHLKAAQLIEEGMKEFEIEIFGQSRDIEKIKAQKKKEYGL